MYQKFTLPVSPDEKIKGVHIIVKYNVNIDEKGKKWAI